MPVNPLKIGDIIEVRFIEMTGVFAQNKWKLARIVEMDSTKLGVQMLREPQKYLYVPLNEQGKMWR